MSLSPLSKIISAEILKTGEMRLDKFIEASLWHESHGYYSTKTVFGRKGDFVTAPEISQIFGEMIGAWIIQTWQRLGAPKKISLLEMGAGRGILMRNALRFCNQVPEFMSALSLHILEKSERLQAIQRNNIDKDIHFVSSLSQLPSTPTIIIANEFYDALPIRQFRFEDGGWLETYINGDLQKVWRPCAQPPKQMQSHMRSGKTIEICEGAIHFASKLGDFLFKNTGAHIAIDYGSWQGYGDTLQAIKAHKFVDPFLNSGESDITAHVRFEDIAEACALHAQFMEQSEFLEAYGGSRRLKQLIDQNPKMSQKLAQDYERLTDPNQMGKLFKVLIMEQMNDVF